MVSQIQIFDFFKSDLWLWIKIWKQNITKTSHIFFKKVKDSSLILDHFSYRWILLKSCKNQLIMGNNGQKLIFSKMCFNAIRKILRKLRKDSCIIQMKKKRWNIVPYLFILLRGIFVRFNGIFNLVHFQEERKIFLYTIVLLSNNGFFPKIVGILCSKILRKDCSSNRKFILEKTFANSRLNVKFLGSQKIRIISKCSIFKIILFYTSNPDSFSRHYLL